MRHRTLFLIAIAITFLLVFGVVIHIDIIFIYKSNPDLYLKYLESLPEFDKTGPGCEMPKSPVMPSFYVQNWRPDFFQNCSYEQKNFRWMDEQNLMLLPSAGSDCCIREVIRGSSDAHYSFTDCKPVRSTRSFHKPTAFIMNCGNSTNGDISLAPASIVLEKQTFWKGKNEEEIPPNVLILGIDTVSRSHAYRSLPKTIGLLKQLDFQDFKSFHSVAANTLSNLIALLGGFGKEKFRKSCVKDWRSSFDSCELIWKDFAARNYVTSYIEDGYQSFNWGGQSGFINQPTDYYWHHFFMALSDVRRQQFQKFSWNHLPYSQACTSSETIPEFLLRYCTRFLQKFAKTPSFLMAWLEDPFHDEIYSLASFDKALHEFFQGLQNKPEILRRTLIIVMSDHGDRFSPFSGKSVESFIERANPMLFVRMPDSLKTSHPHMFRALQGNSQKFTTPFDLHATLRHVLSFSQNRDDYRKQQSFGVGKHSSLFVPFASDRTCTTNNIKAMNCLCGIINYEHSDSYDSPSHTIVSRQMASSTGKLIVEHLNSKIQASKYANHCEQWTSSPEKLVYAGKISDGKDRMEVLLAFTAEPLDAQFEARITIPTKRGVTADTISFVGLSRTSKYRDQSWCVGFETDDDKEMKEFCYCKEPPPLNYTQNFIEKFLKLM